MMSEEELNEMAEDFKVNGLLDPIKLDKEGQVIDGRNRLAACKIAGIEPTFETYEGDAATYALSANVNRRMLSKGQRAMIKVQASMIENPAATAESLVRGSDLNTRMIERARQVIRHAPDLVGDVVSGIAAELNAAAETASQRSRTREAREGRIASLRADASDLASAVESNELDLDAAEKELRERIAVDRSIRDALQRAITERSILEENASKVISPDLQKALLQYAKTTRIHASSIERIVK